MRQYEPVKGHFPYTAVISVTLCLFANNYAITSCFAYTGAMVVHLGAAATRDEAGYSAGLLAASFMIGRGMTALVWGLLADKYGRRPVLITCCLAMVVFQLIFGFATSFGMAIAARFFLGFFNGLVGTSKTAVAELVPGDDVKLQSKAMGILGGAVSFGQLIGPSVGGWLADPVQQFPDTYQGNTFLTLHPFILPNIIGAASALLATIGVYLFLPETKSMKDTSKEGNENLVSENTMNSSTNQKNASQQQFVELEMHEKKDNVMHANVNGMNGMNDDDAEDQITTTNTTSSSKNALSFCKEWRVLWPCLVYAFHSLNSMWLNEAFPLWCLGSTLAGGLSMSLYEIGMLVSISSILLVLFQMFGFHRLVNYFSPTKVFIGGTFCIIPFVFLLPLTSNLSIEMNYTFIENVSMTNHVNVTVLTTEQETSRIGMMLIVGLLFGMSSVVSVTTFSTSFMLINNSCNNDERGAVNGLAMTVASITKAIGPVLGSSILAWSFTQGLGSYPTFWIVSCLWLLLGFTGSSVLPKYKLDVYSGSSGNEISFENVVDEDDEGVVALNAEEEDRWADI